MASAPPTPSSAYYPPPAFAFAVAVVPAGGGSQSAIDAQFQEVSGIDPHVDTEEGIEGGVNNFVYTLPGVTKHSNLVLKRGYVTQASSLASWAEQTVGSTLGTAIQPQVITVTLLSPTQQPMVTWTFQNAWPVKWEVGQFDSSKNDVLTETLEISYTTVTRTLGSSS
jgi:phage tail-like protein